MCSCNKAKTGTGITPAIQTHAMANMLAHTQPQPQVRVQPQPQPQPRIQLATPLQSRLLASPPQPPPQPGVDTAIWGAILWKALHTAGLSAGDRTSWFQIADALKAGLPCPDCAAHFAAWIAANPLRFPIPPQPRQPFVPRFLAKAPTPPVPVANTVTAWILSLHNAVNARLGTAPWTVDQVRGAYTDRADAATGLTTLRGVLGDRLYALLMGQLSP